MSESASNASSSDMGSDMEMAKGTSDNHSGPVPTERIDAIFMHPQDEPNAVIIELGKECAHKVNRFRKVPLPFGLGFNETPVAPWGALWEEALRQLEGVRQPDYAAALREMVPASKIVDSNSLERNFVCLVDTKILRILQDTKAPESSRILAELVNPDLLAHIYRELKCILHISFLLGSEGLGFSRTHEEVYEDLTRLVSHLTNAKLETGPHLLQQSGDCPSETTSKITKSVWTRATGQSDQSHSVAYVGSIHSFLDCHTGSGAPFILANNIWRDAWKEEGADDSEHFQDDKKSVESMIESTMMTLPNAE